MAKRVVIVSGGTGGLGVAVVQQLLDDGWHVVVPWIVEAEVSRLPRADNLSLVEADLFDESQVAAVVDVAKGVEDGELRAVVNLVGGFAMGEMVEATPIEEFERLLRLNLRPLYLLTSAALPALRESGSGSVVGVSAGAAFAPFPGASGYITSKAAVAAFMEAVAVEYREAGVRANVVVPAVIDTQGNRDAQPTSARAGWVDPREIARTISFLVSPASSAVTGARVPVPGVG